MALDQPLGGAGFLGLLGDGHAVAEFQQPLDVRLGRADWNARHRRIEILAGFVGQRDPQQHRYALGVLTEGFKEIADLKEQDVLGVLVAQLDVLRQ